MSKFIDIARENGDIKIYNEVYNSDPDLLENEERNFYIGEKIVKYPRYNIGDIVFIKEYKYKNGENGNNHLFVIVDDDNYGVPINYFCMLISSNLNKLKFKGNVLLEKDENNNLLKNSIVKTDVIYEIKYDELSFCVGKVSIELVNKYIELYINKEGFVYE